MIKPWVTAAMHHDNVRVYVHFNIKDSEQMGAFAFITMTMTIKKLPLKKIVPHYGRYHDDVTAGNIP